MDDPISQDAVLRLHIDKVLAGVQLLSAPAPHVTSFVHGLTDFIPRNITAGDSFAWRYLARPEEDLHNHLKGATKGKGFKHDEPRVGKAIGDSLSKFPELLKLYHR